MYRIYIPPNIEDAGSVFGGLFGTRNFIEASLGAGAGILVYKVLFFFPALIRLAIAVAIGLLLMLIGLFGIYGKPMSLWLMDTIMFRRTRCVVSLRKPQPILLESEKPKRYIITRKKKEEKK